MKSSFRIAKVFGIPVELHWTFLLLLVWVFFAGGGEWSQWREILIWLLTVTALFTCVVLHEFGHALMARRFGVNTRDIILSPIGGVARLEGLPEKPIHEFWVAIAGPLVNVVIILILLPLQFLFPSTLTHFLGLFSEESNTFLWEMFRLEYMIPFLISINLMLVLFNLIPAFPMDGGRVLRSLLAMRFSRLKATLWASRIGQFFAIGIFGLGLFEMNLVLAFIGLFVYFAAGAEYRYVKSDHFLTSYTIGDIIPARFTALRAEDSIYQAGEALARGEGPHFPVVDAEGRLQGILYQKAIRDTLENPPLHPVLVRDQMNIPTASLSVRNSLKDAFQTLNKENQVLPVFVDGNLAGLVSAGQLQQFVQERERDNRLKFFRS
jgi:Zn-dependent protease